MIRRIITSVPNALTCCNLLCGALACIFAFSAYRVFPELCGLNGRQIVWILIGAAAFFDGFDGAAARLLHAPSPLGKELDSLADLVSFGVAPAMLLYNILVVWTCSWWIPYVSLFIPAMGALRLAKFNLDDSQSTTFKGLPIPANAIFWIGATAWMQSHASEWMARHIYYNSRVAADGDGYADVFAETEEFPHRRQSAPLHTHYRRCGVRWLFRRGRFRIYNNIVFHSVGFPHAHAQT